MNNNNSQLTQQELYPMVHRNRFRIFGILGIVLFLACLAIGIFNFTKKATPKTPSTPQTTDTATPKEQEPQTEGKTVPDTVTKRVDDTATTTNGTTNPTATPGSALLTVNINSKDKNWHFATSSISTENKKGSATAGAVNSSIENSFSSKEDLLEQFNKKFEKFTGKIELTGDITGKDLTFQQAYDLIQKATI